MNVEQRAHAPQVPSLATLPVFTGSLAFSKNHGEDWSAVLLRERSAIAVLADGAGGHPDACPCATLAGAAALASLAAGPITEMTVLAAVLAAHTSLRTANAARLLRPDARTTLVIAAVTEGRLVCANHGDSTITVTPVGAGAVAQVLAQADGSFLSPQAHIEPNVFSHPLREAQIVALCSDGAAEGLNLAPPQSPYEWSATQLIEAARGAGSDDDATVALVAYLRGGPQ